ncbi:hypothetical protein AX774_g1766 [Zancudomyces culisetae]|uniref:Secreted protein n=1 Tax=Zancudomyces culisetae TaxID=1213189 RepID=A0A1R1PUV0_ZANCU|nr:hypothetical protein AX774_g1766 [Zancudomyces culisetae]|eukprot:OMH84699.1 hypothetical protein AX774_g1766 [Zancudomyces culisetae]
MLLLALADLSISVLNPSSNRCPETLDCGDHLFPTSHNSSTTSSLTPSSISDSNFVSFLLDLSGVCGGSTSPLLASIDELSIFNICPSQSVSLYTSKWLISAW